MTRSATAVEQQLAATVAAWVAKAAHVVVSTGAGISAESGVPTFRGAQQGLYANLRPEELASRAGFERNPMRVWNWYWQRIDGVRRAEPNAGHHAVAALGRSTAKLTLVTQNVDNLHERAGSTQPLHLHGRLLWAHCLEACGEPEVPAPRGAGTLPRCRCGAPLRPAVVWFGEALPAQVLEQALAACRSCSVLLCVGTSGLVQPAASLPLEALRAGARVVEINPESTPLTPHTSAALPGPAGFWLPLIARQLTA